MYVFLVPTYIRTNEGPVENAQFSSTKHLLENENENNTLSLNIYFVGTQETFCFSTSIGIHQFCLELIVLQRKNVYQQILILLRQMTSKEAVLSYST